MEPPVTSCRATRRAVRARTRLSSGRGRLLVLLMVATAALPACATLYRGASLAYSELVTTFSTDRVSLEMDTSFIAKLKNRVTMRVDFTVEQVKHQPNPPFADGDLHFAGRSPQVGLPVVGEIINAASEQPAMDLVHRAHRNGRPVSISGVWRIWPEHAGNTDETQGRDDEPPQSTNPDHVFEIHPVTRVAGLSLLSSFHPVDGFLPGQAASIVPLYEAASCRLEVKRRTVVLSTDKGLFNDLAFIMEVSGERQKVVADGRFVRASLLDAEGHVLARDRRMVFVKGTPPERAVRGLRAGDRLHVYGIPRVDLSEIARRVRESHNSPALLHESLPYEIVILAVLGD